MNPSAPNFVASSASSRGQCLARLFIAAVVLVAGTGASVQAAAVWQSSLWALHASVGGQVAYDSNIFGRRAGGGDTVFSARPAFRLERLASATQLEVTAEMLFRKYVDFDDEDSVDPTIRVRYAYPHGAEALPTREADLSWSRTSDPDPDVGERIRRTDLRGRYEGTLYDTGKTMVDVILTGGTSENTRFEADSKYGSVGFAVGYLPRGLLKYALGYDYTSSTYERSDIFGAKVSRRAHDLTARLRGELTPKINGRLSVGVTRGDISGAFNFSKTDWTVGAQLEWRPSERRRVALDAIRETYFTADGQVAVNSRLNLGFFQEITGGFTLNLRGNAGTVDRQSGGSDYDVFGGGASLLYGLTGRFNGEVGGNVSRYSSSQAFFDFSRYTVFARVGYVF